MRTTVKIDYLDVWIRELIDAGRISALTDRLAENVCLVDIGTLAETREHSLELMSARIARESSIGRGGQFYGGHGTITWCCGRRTIYLIDRSIYPQLHIAREALGQLGVVAGWSVAGCARRLLDYVSHETQNYRCNEQLAHGDLWGYHDCAPGEYQNLSMYDIKSCYFTLAARLPTLSPFNSPEWLYFHECEAGVMERWHNVIAAIANCKGLRNSLIGNMVKGDNPIQFCRFGETCERRAGRTAYRAAGLLIVRSAWELCRAASIETQSVYSNVDCVITPASASPAVWASVGLESALVTQGDANIYAQSIYRIAKKETALYRLGSRWTRPEPVAEAPPKIFYRQWL